MADSRTWIAAEYESKVANIESPEVLSSWWMYF